MKMQPQFQISILVTALLASAVAMADASDYQWARVVDVEPVEEIHRTPIDREVCWEETVVVRERRHSHAPAVVGAILGGVFGSQFGSGSGRDAATAAGALLGGAIGHDASRHHQGSRYPASRQRCEVEREWRQRTVTSGYEVTYEYDGRLHRTIMPYRPGEAIKVRVTVQPVD